jgi:hypothetical protein
MTGGAKGNTVLLPLVSTVIDWFSWCGVWWTKMQVHDVLETNLILRMCAAQKQDLGVCHGQISLKQTQTLHRNHFPIRETLLPSNLDPKKIN